MTEAASSRKEEPAWKVVALERYVAVDNVCAWPNLTLMPDGAIVATIFNQPTHGGWEGDAECWASTDEGRFWDLRGVPAPHEPGTNRMNLAAELAHNGDLVVLCSGWNKRPPVGEYAGFKGAEILAPWVCRSADGGRTWTQARSGAIEGAPDGCAAAIPFGNIVRLADNSLGASCYCRHSIAYFYRSDDDGRSWRCLGEIGKGQNETALLVLGDGVLLAASRTLGDPHIELFRSEDGGKTWTGVGPLTLAAQIPAHLLQLANGRILLTYGMRNQDVYGVGARISGDNGETWSPPSVLVDFENASDGGYPASVQMPDGTIVTAYYCNRTPAHHRYHMGVLRWKLAE